MRRLAGTIAGMTVALLLVACGGGGVDRTATSRAGDASDSATVTAVARGSGTSGAGSANTTGATGTAGKGSNTGSFRFATLPSGSTGGTVSTAAGGNAPRGTTSASTPGSVRSTAVGVSGSMYKDPQGRYTFTIPQGWRVQQSSSAAADIQISPPQSLRGIVQIASEDVDPSTTLDDYANGMMDILQNSVTNYQTVPNSTQSLKISGIDARRFDFTGQQSGVTLKVAVFITRKDSSAYSLIVAAAPQDFDTVLAQARVTVDSFTFL